MPTDAKAFVKEVDRQRKIEKDRSRKYDEKIKKIEEAAAAKLREDIKQAREKQASEISERKRKAKDNDEWTTKTKINLAHALGGLLYPR